MNKWIRNHYDIYEGNLIFLAWSFLLFSEIFGGVIRYYLSQVGLVELAYLPKIFVFVIGIWFFFKDGINSVGQIFVLLFAAFELLWASMNGLSIKQYLFALWIVQPIFFGFFFYPLALDRWKTVSHYLMIAFFVGVVGVFYTALFSYPWVDSGYSLGGQEIEAVRSWSTFEFDRPPGFTRMSVQAATYLLLTFLLIFPALYERSSYFALFAWMLGIFAIAVTTTKVVVVAIFLAGLVFFIRKSVLTAVGISLICLVSMFLPFTSDMVRYDIDYSSYWGKILLASLDMRLSLTWPITLDLLSQYGDFTFGRGFGGLGSAERMFGSVATGESYNYFVVDLSVSDSYPLYLYGNFGILGVLIFIFQCLISVLLLRRDDLIQVSVGLCLLGIIIIGATTDVIEGPLVSLVMGMSLFALFQRKIIR